MFKKIAVFGYDKMQQRRSRSLGQANDYLQAAAKEGFEVIHITDADSLNKTLESGVDGVMVLVGNNVDTGLLCTAFSNAPEYNTPIIFPNILSGHHRISDQAETEYFSSYGGANSVTMAKNTRVWTIGSSLTKLLGGDKQQLPARETLSSSRKLIQLDFAFG